MAKMDPESEVGVFPGGAAAASRWDTEALSRAGLPAGTQKLYTVQDL